MTEGLLTIAYGPLKYIEMAQALSLSYRRLNPSRPIAVVTDEKNRLLLQQYFDIVILFREEYVQVLSKSCTPTCIRLSIRHYL